LDKDFGDFQTPLPLVSAILHSLTSLNKRWTRVLEPTCGRGNFIAGLLRQDVLPSEIQGIEIQKKYVQEALSLFEQTTSASITIEQKDIFAVSLRDDLHWQSKGPLLVLGNPPWVTNAELGVLGSNNLPQKINFKGLSGLDARTGKANFDIAEYIWLKLIRELAAEQPTIALLCKTSVARNVLQHPYKVAVSGLHKIPKFRVLAPIDGQPVMLDDTCYFIPCSSLEEASRIASVLNDQLCLNYIQSIVFLDAKRPITKKLLQRIHIPELIKHVDGD